LIGVHGAGLTLLYLLPPHAVVIEVISTTRLTSFHFRNLAAHSDRFYLSLTQTNSDEVQVTVNNNELGAKVKTAVELLNL